MKYKVNIGCGQTPTPGWKNFDNSLSLRLAKMPFVVYVFKMLNFTDEYQQQFIHFCINNDIEYGDATKGLPLSNESVEVLYSSHMLEHLDRYETNIFFKEAFRVLCPGGFIRLAVPDLKKQIANYNSSGDADSFIKNTLLCVERPRTFAQRLRLLCTGSRHHQWMFDGNSLSQLLIKYNFVNVEIMPAGNTKIVNHEPCDLMERAAESVYVEAEKPDRQE